MKQRIAVAGAGVFGRHHMRVLQTLDTAELTGVYDIDPARAAEAAADGLRCSGKTRRMVNAAFTAAGL